MSSALAAKLAIDDFTSQFCTSQTSRSLPPATKGELCFSSETSIRWRSRITAESHTATSHSNHSRLIAPSQTQEPLRNRRSTCFKRAAESQHCSRITAEPQPHHSCITPKTKPNHSHITAASQPNHSHMPISHKRNCVSQRDEHSMVSADHSRTPHSHIILVSQPLDRLITATGTSETSPIHLLQAGRRITALQPSHITAALHPKQSRTTATSLPHHNRITAT